MINIFIICTSQCYKSVRERAALATKQHSLSVRMTKPKAMTMNLSMPISLDSLGFSMITALVERSFTYTTMAMAGFIR